MSQSSGPVPLTGPEKLAAGPEKFVIEGEKMVLHMLCILTRVQVLGRPNDGQKSIENTSKLKNFFGNSNKTLYQRLGANSYLIVLFGFNVLCVSFIKEHDVKLFFGKQVT